MPKLGSSQNAGRAAFAYPDLVSYEVGRLFIVLALEMQSVAVGWQVYDITKRPLDLGLVWLAQCRPGFFLFLVSGHVADRFDRRHLLLLCYTGFALSSGLLLKISWHATPSVKTIYLVLVLLGVVRSFNGPAGRALLPQLVPEEHFPGAVAWNASVFQSATIMGPVVGGLIYAAFHGPAAVYATAMAGGGTALFAVARIEHRMRVRRKEQVGMTSVLAGFRYVRKQKLILGSISLDMFAVLLGGAVALLPVYAREILRTGPWGLGLLRSAPGIGAATMAIVVAHWPLRRRAGAVMLWCVAGFGVFTIVFGVSRSLVLSLGSLLLAGAADMVSVIVRA